MKYLVVILTLLIVQCSADRAANTTAEEPVEANEVGGGNLDVSSVVEAHDRLHANLNFCLSSPRCYVSKKEEVILQKIIEETKQENRSRLLFLRPNAAEFSRYFAASTGTEKDAMATELGVRLAPIAINLSEMARYRDGGLPAITGLLAHEYAHHHGYPDHEELAAMGKKIEKFLQIRRESVVTQSLPLGLTVTMTEPFSEMNLWIDQSRYRLTEWARERVNCNSRETETERRHQLRGLMFHGIEMASIRRWGDSAEVSYRMNAMRTCEVTDEVGPEYLLVLRVHRADDRWQLLLDKSRFEPTQPGSSP